MDSPQERCLQQWIEVLQLALQEAIEKVANVEAELGSLRSKLVAKEDQIEEVLLLAVLLEKELKVTLFWVTQDEKRAFWIMEKFMVPYEVSPHHNRIFHRGLQIMQKLGVKAPQSFTNSDNKLGSATMKMRSHQAISNWFLLVSLLHFLVPPRSG